MPTGAITISYGAGATTAKSKASKRATGHTGGHQTLVVHSIRSSPGGYSHDKRSIGDGTAGSSRIGVEGTSPTDHRLVGSGANTIVAARGDAVHRGGELDGGGFRLHGRAHPCCGHPLEIAVRKSTLRTYRLAVAVALFTAFCLVWANGAVGIIGAENNPINLLY